jgi:hypothetical protein
MAKATCLHVWMALGVNTSSTGGHQTTATNRRKSERSESAKRSPNRAARAIRAKREHHAADYGRIM